MANRGNGMKIRSFLFGQYRCLRLLSGIGKKYFTQDTKSPLRRYLDAQKWFVSNGEYCVFYYAWGLNAKNAKLGEFISRKEVMRLKTVADDKLKQANALEGIDYGVITKDKFVAGSFLEANGIPCAKHHGIIVGGSYIATQAHTAQLEDLMRHEGELFFKSVAMEAGDGVVHAKLLDGAILADGLVRTWPEFLNKLGQGVWLVQSKLESHADLRRINGSALNTTRVVTIMGNSGPEYLNGFQAFATGNARTDSWSKGSVYVGIDVVNGCLKEYGIYHPDDSSKSITDRHPDSKIIFHGYQIPYLKEAVQLCISAHRLFYNSFVIGWDVAITDLGPVIIEANERPGMNAVQCLDGGCRKRMITCLAELNSRIRKTG
jgi:hypothetical protein